jgi:predicted DNA-binding transcriptional regulator YafY
MPECTAVDTTARMLRLLSLLQARPSWPGPELAERLGVTPRTLRRDMARLRDQGYPVEAESGPNGGYRLVAGGALPPLLLDDDEAIAVSLALRAAASGSLPGFEDSAIAALSKIEQVLPAKLRRRVESIDSSVVRIGGHRSGSAPMNVDELVTIAQACRGPERLRFDYRDANGVASARHVDPYRLVHAARRWYLVARDRDRDAWRSFRVDRISSIQSTGMPARHTDPPDAAAFVAEGLAVGAYPSQARVLLRVPAKTAAAMVHPTVGVLEPASGGTLLRIGADDHGWIARYLASLNCSFTVLDPPELSDAVRALAARLASDSATQP